MLRYPPSSLLLSLALAVPSITDARPPEVRDSNFELTLFAEHPDIVTPIGATFDRNGRLLVIESQTHFRPDNYVGPPADRIRVLEDTNADGRADRFTSFHEGLTHAMALATAPDGSIYVATRAKILRLADADNNGIADKDGERVIATLETTGSYPHNGLSGLAFDHDGGLWFGLGENLGAPYQLIAADGTTLSGGGEGGNVYRCHADGSGLRRVATGMWNPFGLCVDPVGRVFCVDNDPDATPYCRLLHIVPGGDYGYEFRYGRSGKHPLQAWEGELPGILPIVASTGEAPCAVLPFEGQLWSTSWGHNRIERFALNAEGASWKSTAETVIQGDPEFRPVDFAPAPDGSLFFTDWVNASYPVHQQGRVWRLARKKGTKDPTRDWPALTPGEIAAAKARATFDLSALETDDRFLWQAAVWGFVQHVIPSAKEWPNITDPRARLGVLAAAHWKTPDDPTGLLTFALADSDPNVQLAAARWVADEALIQHRPALEKIAATAAKETQLAKAARAALEHLDQTAVAP
jgi:putative membrane-bound dehydrogenase-like protein